jgi:glycosyltransferase involved in cell wall biosynthesis
VTSVAETFGTNDAAESPRPRGGSESFAVESWVADFRTLHGRSPRVLHIGNIANNAYLNAKALNEVGIESDVLCYDYYHIMGCPEWEDGDFEGRIRNDFLPNWSDVKLRGFHRPRWFIQAPLRDAVSYLIARREGARVAAWWRWRRNEIRRWIVCRPPLARAVSRVLTRLRKIGRTAANLPRTWKRKGRSIGNSAPAYAQSVLFRLNGLARSRPPVGLALASSLATVLAVLAVPCALLATLFSLVICIVWLVTLPLRRLIDAALAGRRSRRLESAGLDEAQWQTLCKDFRRWFPAREDALTTADAMPYRSVLPMFRRLFRNYDAIIGYSTDGVLPLLVGKRPYFAYEHGTIRNIPFQPTIQGRLCATTYRASNHAFITNCDNILAAGILGLERFGFVPHPVNESPVSRERVQRLRSDLERRLESDFIVFHPSRQHWEERRHPDWEKGNDLFLRGFARLVQEVAPRASAVLVDWGQKVDDSKALIAELGIASRVLWIPTQGNRRMSEYVAACDVLADQFWLGAFGSTTPKAFLHGRPALLYLDEERHRWCMPELPPVLNAKLPDEVFEALREVYESADRGQELGARSRAWYDRYHSNRVIVQRFAEVLAEHCA